MCVSSSNSLHLVYPEKTYTCPSLQELRTRARKKRKKQNCHKTSSAKLRGKSLEEKRESCKRRSASPAPAPSPNPKRSATKLHLPSKEEKAWRRKKQEAERKLRSSTVVNSARIKTTGPVASAATGQRPRSVEEARAGRRRRRAREAASARPARALVAEAAKGAEERAARRARAKSDRAAASGRAAARARRRAAHHGDGGTLHNVRTRKSRQRALATSQHRAENSAKKGRARVDPRQGLRGRRGARDPPTCSRRSSQGSRGTDRLRAHTGRAGRSRRAARRPTSRNRRLPSSLG